MTSEPVVGVVFGRPVESKTTLSYICLPFHSPTQASQLTGTSSYYRFRCHYPLITYLKRNDCIARLRSWKSVLESTAVLMNLQFLNHWLILTYFNINALLIVYLDSLCLCWTLVSWIRDTFPRSKTCNAIVFLD